MFKDLREYIQRVEEMGECRLIEGADAGREVGALTHLMTEKPDTPLLLFDRIKGYAPGYRVASNLFTTPRRAALGLGLPLESKGMEQVRAFRDKINAGMKLIPPVEVATGPVMENVIVGEEVDLFKFPTPRWHELDGGPYIGTGTMTIARDPDDGWVNVGCYRVQVQDRKTATIHITPTHHLDIIQKKWWKQGKACPAAVTCGQEPMTWLGSCWPAPWGVCEYDIAGWWRGAPVEVVKGVTTGLPIPATAEIVLEGEIVPPEVETRIEGPFGEWSGYYATGQQRQAAFQVKSVLHRNDPIIQGNPPSRVPSVWSLGVPIQMSATIWSELDRQIPGVKGVWLVDLCNSNNIIVVSLKQEYPGHARQAAAIVAGTRIASRYLHYLIVVDDDIDPSNISDVLWAVGTRADPETAIDIIKGQVSAFLDTTIPPEKRKAGNSTTSVAVILAVKPYHWKEQFAIPITVSPPLKEEVMQKWAGLFQS